MNVIEFGIVQTQQEHQRFITAWEETFQRQLDPQVYDWVFNDRNKLYVFWDGDQVAAGYALLDQEVVLDGVPSKGALCNNVFVRPAYQAQNLFVKLARQALSHAETRGVRIAIGMPNANAVPGHRRVGWTFQPPVHFLEIPRTQLKLNASSPVQIDEVSRERFVKWAEALELFSRRQASNRTFSVIKTKDYFTWRYLQRPSTSYRVFIAYEGESIVGFVVYKVFLAKKRLHIVDLDGTNESVVQGLLAKASQLEGDFDLINVWGSNIHRKVFEQAGFRESEELNELIAIYPYRRDPIQLGNQVHLVLGDNDVF